LCWCPKSRSPRRRSSASAGRFGDVVAVLHSGLSEGERHDEWHRIHDGRARVVVGARSALFAPVRELGLIVVDEEHEPAYKQEETPRYHARDVAVMRGKMEGCAVVLGTATPSLESWQNARAGKYRLIRMPHRVDHRAMPEIHIIDLRSEAGGRDQKRGLFAGVLVDELRGRTQSGEQAILFLNRRGYARAPHLPRLRRRGALPRLQHCARLPQARGPPALHICGRTERPPTQCPNPACGDPAIRMAGAGTEKVEELLRRLLPHVEVARMDSDTMTRRDEYRRVLTAFRSGKIQVLIGTQMIAKGLHFPNVTLVGVINADVTLHMPDFRAGERTLQLLTQVAGRAGRGEAPGRVLVQTFTPFHPAIQAARRMDFETFCDQELAFRKELGYPPFSRMINVLFRGRDEAKVRAAATAFAAAAAPPASPPKGWTASEALPAALARAHGEYRYQVLLRGPKTNRAMHDAVRAALALKRPKDVHASADVDPVSVM
jgi:primosomal protein N' (replication factor Y) (superfamily II helicase)